ncbi:MAG: leucine-rich repeat domain-containing protein [Promethearchaeota archaeon]
MDIPFEAYRGSEPYIFVSYAHKDSRVVYTEIKRLYDAGYRIWYDEGIPLTTEWPAEIQIAIDNCAFFLVFISPDAVESENVRNEINYAKTKKKKVLAIFIKEAELKHGLGIQIGSRQAIMKYQLSDDTRYYRMLTRELPASLKSCMDSPSKPISAEYKGCILVATEVDILMELEHQLEKPIPEVSSIGNDTFGFTAKDEHVTGLGLYNQNLSVSPLKEPITREEKVNRLVESYTGEAYFLPETFFQLTNLQILSLGANQFTTFPEAIGDLKKLEKLWLYNNQLTILPKAIGNLKKLEWLSLRYNRFEFLPEAFGQLRSLQILNLQKNKLSFLPESFGQLQNLGTLWLGGNELKALPESFFRLTDLYHLDLSDNKFTTLPESIGNLRNLKNLWLYGNPFSEARDERKKVERLIPPDCTINWDSLPGM